MNTYSHLVLAWQLETQLKPLNPSDYYWGAIVPDIRYFTGMPRRHTHLPQDRLLEYLTVFPHLESFIQGYRVHCLLDEIDLNLVFARRLMFRLVRNHAPRQLAPVLLEYYYLDTVSIHPPVSGSANEILDELGIRDEAIKPLTGFLETFLASPSFETEASALRGLGLVDDPRIIRYLQAAASLDRQRWLKALLFKSLDFKDMSHQFLAYVLERMIEPYHS